MATREKTNTDVISVGGGLIGCSIALRLAQAKLRVAVFDRGEPGCEASSAAAGMIAPQGETAEPDAFYDLCAASRDLYPAFAAEVEDLSGQRVEFHADGALVAALDDTQAEDLDRIYKAQRKAGIPVERLTAEEGRRRAPSISPSLRGALVMAGDYRVDNELLVKALTGACQKAGVIFHTHATVVGFVAGNGRVESVTVRHGETAEIAGYTAGCFVLAAGAWSAELAALLQISIPVIPCRGQLIEFDDAADFLPVIRAGHYYFVCRSGGRLVAGSNMEYAGFQKAVTAEGLRSILEALHRVVPCAKDLRFRRAWAGFRPDTADQPNLVFATGHFRNGVLLTPITAKLISELILSGSTSRALDSFSPRRFQI
jgi:glycine oxidase